MKIHRVSLLSSASSFSAIVLLLCAADSSFGQSVWSGSSGVWSSTTLPGWTSGGVPNGIGAVASFSGGLAGTTTQDVAGAIIGTYDFSAGNVQRTLTLTNALTFNQDGAGAGYATISNSNTNTGSGNRLTINSGTLTLADDLLISNTGSSTNTSGAITFSGVFTGAGNLTISNVSNVLGVGQIALTGVSTFTGNVLVQKGALTISNNTGLGSSSNAVTLGSTGNSTTLVTAGSVTNLSNNITVVATSGTNLLGSTSTANSNSTFSGTITMNGDLSVMSVKPAGSDLRFTGQLTGVGALTKTGAGTVLLSNTNTYTGGTSVTAGTLVINGFNNGSAVTVSNAGSVLGGTGTIAPGASHALTVDAGAIVSSGTVGGIGTLTVSLNSTGDSATFSSGAKFAFDLAAPGTNDKVAFASLTASVADVTFNNNVVDFTDLGGLAAGSYTLFTFDQIGAYTGTLAIGTGLGAYVGSNFSYNTNSIVLNVVPEPSAAAMMGLGFTGALYLLRRRRS
ncbi:hypothetical protein BH09VER1_BH09VER1_03840 [soil metagenome]